MTIGDRLKQVINNKGISSYEISLTTGVSQATLSRILNNTTLKPSTNTLNILANYLNIHQVWLRTGEGEMLKSSATDPNSLANYRKVSRGAHVKQTSTEEVISREVFDQLSRMMDIPNINSRIRELIDIYADKSVRKFAGIIGISQQTLNRLFNIDTRTKKYPIATTEILIAITEKFVIINPTWLLTGRGNMLEEENAQQMQVVNHTPSAATVAQQSIPVYDLQIGAQSGSLFDGGLTPINYITLPNLPKCDGAMVLYGGDTMTPALETGDILVYRRVKDIRKGLFLGHIYIVTFELEGEEYLMVRRIEQSEDKESLKLVSNRVSQDILFDSIKGMAMVKASIRRYDP